MDRISPRSFLITAAALAMTWRGLTEYAGPFRIIVIDISRRALQSRWAPRKGVQHDARD